MDAGDYLLLAGLPIPWTFFCTKERQIPNLTEGSPYITIRRTQLCLCSISAGPYYLWENVLSCKDENVDLHIYYTVNMAAVNYCGTQIPEKEKNDGHIETTDIHENDLKLALVLIASIIGVLSFIIGMTMVKKWFSINNTVTAINTSVSKVTKQLTGAISLLRTIRGAETTDLNDCQKEYIIKIGITWHEIMIFTIYEVIILIAIVLIVRLIKHMYRLCNLTIYKCQTAMLNKIAVQSECWETRVIYI